MKLVAGLGNPGRKYQGTRHNVGFDVLAELARRYPPGSIRNKFEAELADTRMDTEPVLLLSPLTYMNRSGISVKAACDFYKLQPDQLLVVCDDFQLPLGRLRFRAQGSAGGHNGLADIIRRLGTNEFARLRIGIGSPPPNWDVADFVLSRFTEQDRPIIDEAIVRAADGVVDWVRQGIAYCMNHYNGA